MLILFSAMSISAQEETSYRPLAKEGKVWNFAYLNVHSTSDHTALYYSYIIQGDTTIHGRQYKKLYFRHSRFNIYTAALRDEGCRAYMIPADSTSEFIYYDLELKEDIKLAYGMGIRPYGGPTMTTSHGLSLRQQSWISYPVRVHRTWEWIESIGCKEDFFMCQVLNDEKDKMGIGGYGGLISCYEDGVCIYGDENGIPEVHRIPVPLAYEAKDGLNHAPSEIWAEAEDGFITIYLRDVRDHFGLYITEYDGNEVFEEERKTAVDLYGTMIFTYGLTIKGWAQSHPDFFVRYRFESDYEIFTIDISTAIHDLAAPEMVNGQSSNGKWYDLLGRRLSVSPASSVPYVLPKGVYIKDGQKVMVK